MREGARKRAGAAPGPPASLSGLKTPLSGSSAFEQVDGAFFRSPGYPASAAGGRDRRPRGALPTRARDRTRFPGLLPAALRVPMRPGARKRPLPHPPLTCGDGRRASPYTAFPHPEKHHKLQFILLYSQQFVTSVFVLQVNLWYFLGHLFPPGRRPQPQTRRSGAVYTGLSARIRAKAQQRKQKEGPCPTIYNVTQPGSSPSVSRP